MFCGGCDISVNTKANNILSVDNNKFLIEILHEFQNKTLEEILFFIKKRIEEFKLSQTNYNGYVKYQELYNTNIEYHAPLDLFVLSRYSFSNLIRFNKNGKMNSSFGMNRGGYNSTQEKNLIAFHPKLQSIKIECKDFKKVDLEKFDFIYADPPYFNSGAIYNTKGYGGLTWNNNDDDNLLNKLEKTNNKFALSNLIRHKGQENVKLI